MVKSAMRAMDAVQEFSVQQNSVDAEYGHSAGGIMSVGMKSGTNEFRGAGYWLTRNTAEYECGSAARKTWCDAPMREAVIEASTEHSLAATRILLWSQPGAAIA